MTRLGRVFLACLAAVAFVCGAAEAGQPRRAPAAPEEPDPTAAMSIEEIRAYQGFFYASGGRDPLTMRYPTDSERGAGQKSGPRKAPTLEEQEAMLRQWLEDITSAVKKQNYEAALEISGDAIGVIDNEWPPLKAELTELVRMNDEIRGLARLAGRLKNQQDIGREFAALGLRVDGVIWSPTDAKAVVDGKTRSAGEVLLEERKQGDLRVEMIEEHGVVFQYRGMRFRLPVQLYAPMDDGEDAPPNT